MDKWFEIHRDPTTGEQYVATRLTGAMLLEHPLLNKGSAFTLEERQRLGLTGLLPTGVSSLQTQIERIYGNYRAKQTNLERYMHLISLQDRNETAFYRLISEHLAEMMPILWRGLSPPSCLGFTRRCA